MSKTATGTVRWTGKNWAVRVTMLDGSRRLMKIDAALGEGDVETAKILGAEISSRVRAEIGTMLVPAKSGLSVSEYFIRWAARKNNRSDLTYKYNKHVAPIIGALEIVAVQPAHMEAVVRYLDDAIRTKQLAWRTANAVWFMLRSLFREARTSKVPSLRVITADPTRDVQRPDKGAERIKQYLWPSEFLQLMQSRRVPHDFKRKVALCTYTYTRLGELIALDWADVHLDDGYIHVHQAMNAATRTVGMTKGANKGATLSRRIPIEPALMPLLRAMHQESGGVGPVVGPLDSPKEWSSRLKRYLRLAGVSRAELFGAGGTTCPVRWHDLRATGITWAIVRGDNPAVVAHRAHHTNINTTMEYIREAENLRATFGNVFPELPPCVIEPRTVFDKNFYSGPRKNKSARESAHVQSATGK